MRSNRAGRRWVPVVLIFVALCLAGWTSYGQKPSPKPLRAGWEYKILQGVTEQELNQLGADGWELVAVTASDGQVAHYLKRAK